MFRTINRLVCACVRDLFLSYIGELLCVCVRDLLLSYMGELLYVCVCDLYLSNIGSVPAHVAHAVSGLGRYHESRPVELKPGVENFLRDAQEARLGVNLIHLCRHTHGAMVNGCVCVNRWVCYDNMCHVTIQ